MPGLEVKTRSSGGGSCHDGGYGAYEGYTEEWTNYSGCEVRYVPDGDGVHGDIGYRTSKIDVGFDAYPGDNVFVVVAVYTTGGTFGQTRGNTEVVGVYDTADKALFVKNLIMDDYQNNRLGSNSITFEKQDIYTGSWKGYFESLEAVHTETEVVRG